MKKEDIIISGRHLSQAERTILHFQEGGDVDDLDSELWGFLMMHKPKVEAFHQHFLHIIQQDNVAEKKGVVSFVVPTVDKEEKTVEFPVVTERPFKSKQWWIWGETNVGKSTIWRKLIGELGLEGFAMPKTTRNFTAWNDKAYHFAYIDQYKGEHSIQFLNEWLEGSPIQLDDNKYGHREKRFNIPTFVFSNFPPSRVYPQAEAEELRALLGRLEVIHMQGHAKDFAFTPYHQQ